MGFFELSWAPIWTLVIGILVVLIFDVLMRRNSRDITTGITAFTLITTGFFVNQVRNNGTDTSLFKFGEFYFFFGLVGLLSSLLVVFVAYRDMRMELDLGVFYSLLLLANVGGLVVASADNMIVLYIGYELVSLPSFAMAAFKKRDKIAAEAALKFFLLGALSSAIIVFGLALYYGATGTFAMAASTLSGAEGLKIASTVLIASGSGFKIGLVPFHFWIADVYAGSPSSVVTWLAASSKKMAFAFVIQLFFVGMIGWRDIWGVIFIILAILSMLLGNIAAVIQTNVMRILAYSTIAQAGYIMIGFASYGIGLNEKVALEGIGLHIIAHVLMKGAAIIATFVVIDNFGNASLENFRGLFYKSKLVSVSLAIALFSLMGIPPLLGAFGKYWLFQSAVANGLGYLAIVGLVGSAISIYYYMKIMISMMDQSVEVEDLQVTNPIKVMLVLLSILTVILPIFLQNVLVVIDNIADNL